MQLRSVLLILCIVLPSLPAQSPPVYPDNIVKYQQSPETKVRISDAKFEYKNGLLTIVSCKLHNDSDRTLVYYQVNWRLTLAGETAHPSLGFEGRGPIAPPHSIVEVGGNVNSSISGVPVTEVLGQVLRTEFADGFRLKSSPNRP